MWNNTWVLFAQTIYTTWEGSILEANYKATNLTRRWGIIYTGTCDVLQFLYLLCSSSHLSEPMCFMMAGRMSLGANLKNEKLLRSHLADDTATFLLEGVLVLWNAFDEDVLLLTTLNVVLDFFTAFGCLKWTEGTILNNLSQTWYNCLHSQHCNYNKMTHPLSLREVWEQVKSGLSHKNEIK